MYYFKKVLYFFCPSLNPFRYEKSARSYADTGHA